MRRWKKAISGRGKNEMAPILYRYIAHMCAFSCMLIPTELWNYLKKLILTAGPTHITVSYHLNSTTSSDQ